jgi:hypothetical protein
MNYRLRVFTNRLQSVSSIGWVFVIIAIVTFFNKGINPVSLTILPIGIFSILFQLRGRRVVIDTTGKKIIRGYRKENLDGIEKIVFIKSSFNQTISSRVSTSSLSESFYQALLYRQGEKQLISSNRTAQRDLEKLKKIAEELRIPFDDRTTP